MGFQTLKVQKYALQIYDDLRTIKKGLQYILIEYLWSSKKLEEAMEEVNKFGTDARVLNRTLENIKDPRQSEKLINHDEKIILKNQSKLKN